MFNPTGKIFSQILLNIFLCYEDISLGVTVQTFNASTSQTDISQCLVVRTPMDIMSKS